MLICCTDVFDRRGDDPGSGPHQATGKTVRTYTKRYSYSGIGQIPDYRKPVVYAFVRGSLPDGSPAAPGLPESFSAGAKKKTTLSDGLRHFFLIRYLS
jgi:hypothetical protein